MAGLPTSAFDYELPDELIAQEPVEPRESSRLMVVDRRRGTIAHHHFFDLPELLEAPDILVRNDSKVIPARLLGQRLATGGRWEGLFLRELEDGTWEVLASTRGRPAPGEQVIVGRGLVLILERRQENGHWVVRPHLQEAPGGSRTTLALLEEHGQVPLPPYIRKGREGPGDRVRYQTVYAQRPGSIAAPTAGLHFGASVFRRLEQRGIHWADLTLHVGVGTFRPIETDAIEDHIMHSEWAELRAETAALLNHHRTRGGRIVAVGTTSARTLETAAASGTIQPFSGFTNLYLRPGHVFQGLDALITNFHLPRSSLLVLVSALAGTELIRAAYAEAISQRYRFYSYGDAMLII